MSSGMAMSVRHHGGRTSKRSAVALTSKPSACRLACTSSAGTAKPSSVSRRCRVRETVGHLGWARVDVDHAGACGAAAELDQQLRRAARGVRGELRRQSALEPRGRLAAQVQSRRGAADAARLEARRLEEDGGRLLGDLGRLPAHHARERDRAAVVRDEQCLRGEFAVFAIEGAQPLARSRRPHADSAVAPSRGRTRAAAARARA